ncbi:MAG: hypothetical protein M3362_25585 [Acidobacteriota bacterium]|nr:hypothetical protein [Acidobacteriota bacterium]
MSILGAIFAFVVVLLIGIPLVLITSFTAINNSCVVSYLARIAQPLLGGFFIVYLFAVLHSIIIAAFGEFITVTATSFRTRWVLLWFLSLFYVLSTAFYLVFGAPPLLYFHLNVLARGPNATVAGMLSFAWLLLVFSIFFQFIVVLIGYIVASVLAPPHDQYVYSDGEMFARGLLIGFNAGMNLLLGAAAIGGVLAVYFGIRGLIIGVGAGIILAFVTLLTAGMPTGSEDANSAIKRIVGWMSWMMPTNWLVTSLGWVLYVTSALFCVLLGWTPFYGLYLINAILIEWPYGTLFIEGGIGSNLRLQGGTIDAQGAYNLGLFAFFHADTVKEVEPISGTVTAVGLSRDLMFDANGKATRKHESGHNEFNGLRFFLSSNWRR